MLPSLLSQIWPLFLPVNQIDWPLASVMPCTPSDTLNIAILIASLNAITFSIELRVFVD